MIFRELEEKYKEMMLESALGNEGKVDKKLSGMCGDVYILDRGPSSFPRYSCAKIPKLLKGLSEDAVNARFVNELENQLKYFHHQYVHWAYDFKEVMGVPVALFRYWGSDLRKVINNGNHSLISKLSIIVYLCIGLKHCNKNGMISHQDLKPENIFIRNMRDDFRELPKEDVYIFPLIGDFGLANASIDSNFFEGARPYMAPEQWLNNTLSSKTDVFSLGVILFELVSDGYHPVGIKLSDFWPEPPPGNGKKWIRPEPWRKWATGGDLINKGLEKDFDPDILILIKGMLATNQEVRPKIEDVLVRLLEIIKSNDESSHSQLILLINHYDSQVTTEDLEHKWPSLFTRWKRFKDKFGQ